MKPATDRVIQEKTCAWPEFFSVINNELAIIEENLMLNLEAKSHILKEIISYLLQAGGKRFRPALCLLIAKATGQITEKHIKLAELTELIHTASLIHDDIIDSAKLRRGIETVNSLWNDKIAVISGDFLFAQASVRLGEIENTHVVKIYAKVLSDLCDGEIEQYSSTFNTNISWDYYLHKSTTKTASLFAATCKSSAILNKQDSKIIEQTERFGRSLGIAFQIVDDILDFISCSREIGKEVGTDLKQGIITAPTLFALKSVDERSKQIKILIENRFNNKDEDFDTTVRLIHELGSCDKAKQLASKYINDAKDNTTFVSDQTLRSYLLKAADFILSRI